MEKEASTATSARAGDVRNGHATLVIPSPTSGSTTWPTTAIRNVATQAIIVNHTTHGLRRCVASEIAPKTGIETTTIAEAIPLTVAYRVLLCPRSATNHAEKYSVAMFIENTVFAKS